MPYRKQVRFAQQTSAQGNLVRACSPTEIRVGERIIRSSVILTASEIVFDWPPLSVAELTPAHLEMALRLKPQVILLGTGARQVFPDARVVAAVQHAGVGFEAMDTPAACRTYNILMQEGRNVAAALILNAVAGSERR